MGMAASPMVSVISLVLTVMGLRGLWKLQHKLDLRGYLLQAAGFAAGLALTLAGYYQSNRVGAILFDIGVISMGAFVMIPDLIYYCLRLYDRYRTRRSATE
jgi:hypothetical protein